MNSQSNVQPPVRRRLYENVEGEQCVEEIPFVPDEIPVGSPPALFRSANDENAFYTPVSYEEDELMVSEQEPFPVVSVPRVVRNEQGHVQIPRTITGMGPTRVVYDVENQIQENNEITNYQNRTHDDAPVNTITYYDCAGVSFTVNNPNPI